jgi:hypothetical protein
MRRVLILLLVPSLTILAAVISAQEAGPDRSDPRDPPRKADRERLALQFAREHHAELSELLRPLRERAPAEYAEAIRELSRTREQLDRIRRRDPNRAALVLDTWKAGSRVRMLAARLVSTPESPREAELRQALADQLAAQLALQKYDRAQLQKRLDQLDRSIHKQEQRADSLIEARLRAVRKKAQRVRRQAETEEQAPSAPSPARTQGDSM